MCAAGVGMIGEKQKGYPSVRKAFRGTGQQDGHVKKMLCGFDKEVLDNVVYDTTVASGGVPRHPDGP